ncbi:isochorismate synthase 2, chloroplastic isoform X1 [Benincasa hispida]|uniref:isochorismate synthase 2, chloroplastic isoform X1 n=1 Tax=Benincasa hispida TaxID=102211 RepID=UPI0018FF7637|nr:isochorismate synthase 2, chloroplastic isoform X1 [Benincasa hispida]
MSISKMTVSRSQNSATRQCVGFGQRVSRCRRIPAAVPWPGRGRRWVVGEVCQSAAMDGCGGDGGGTVGTIETRTFPAVQTAALATESLRRGVAKLKLEAPALTSGIIRLQVPIQQRIQAIDWLSSQPHLLPRTFFSGRSRSRAIDSAHNTSNGSHPFNHHHLLGAAGVGSAVVFHRLHCFSYNDWASIKRFLSKKCPLIRAYGVIRFDSRANISPEWEPFGSFYFMVPQVEFDEFEENSMLAATVAWDHACSWTWENAVESLQSTMEQVSSNNVNLQKDLPLIPIHSYTHVPSKTFWDRAVDRALQEIDRSNSELTKVVLARSTRIVTSVDIDPVTWVACLQKEGKNSYQFCVQPSNAPAFIGNTPERLFHREGLGIKSDALAATRARGRSPIEDIKIEHDLFSNPKDDLEFSIVRETIKKKLEAVCDAVVVEPHKSVRKLPRIQHLYAQLTGRLRSEEDEFEILSTLHPTPAVCGLPTNEARDLIAETEVFDRGMYAGPVGWFGGGESEFAVGIRSALVKRGLGALIYAGTGIVKGSNPSSEWDELELKISQITRSLKLEVAQAPN